jgi:hypothetical protein
MPRRVYFQNYEKKFFAEFHKMAAKTPDARLLATKAYWLDKAKTMTLQAWQEVLSKGEGGKPFYDTVAQEVAEMDKERHRDRGGREM